MKSCGVFLLTVLLLGQLCACGGGESSSAPQNSSSDTTSSSSTSSNESSSSSLDSSSSVASVSSASSEADLVYYEINTDSLALCRLDGVVESEHAGYSAGGYWNGSNNAGASLEFSLSNIVPGPAVIKVTYANGSDSARQGQLSLGDQSQVMEFAPTGEWSNWQSAEAQLNVSSEELLLKLVSLNDAGLANIDKIEISGDSWKAEPCPSIGGLLPLPNSTNNPADTFLSLRFDSRPSVNTSGSVQIFDHSNGALVDNIPLANDSDFITGPGLGYGRSVKRTPYVIIDTELIIYPHSNKLQANKQYSVVIGAGAFNGTMNGQTISQISSGEWVFSTKSTPANQTTVSVDDDSDSDFRTVQGALNYFMAKQFGESKVVVAPGQYHELLFLRGLQNISITGAGPASTRIFSDNAEAINGGSGASSSGNGLGGGRSLFLIENTSFLTLDGLLIENTYGRDRNGGSGAQAETMYFNSSGRLRALNAAFKSEQDTLLLKGYSWFYNSKVTGNVDFIWGYPKVALFESTEIESIGDSKSATTDSGGYVVQARVQSAGDPGIIFLNSRFTNTVGKLGNSIGFGKTYLARSGNGANSASVFDSVSFINCQFDTHVAGVGWFDESSKGKFPNPSRGSATTGLKEYNSQNLSGQALNASRASAFYSLSSGEFNSYYSSRNTIFDRLGQGGSWLNN